METFIKVYIKSEDDLPKYGEGELLCQLKSGNIGYYPIGTIRCDYERVDWYLNPVEIPEIDNDTILALPLDVPSDEEIEKKAMNHNRTDNYTTIDYYSTGIIVGSKWVRDEILKRNK